MKANTSQAYKAEIKSHLMVAREKIEEIIYLVESNKSWKQIHIQTEETVSQLKQSTKLLARHHLENCIPKKQRLDGRFSDDDMNEIIKTSAYIS